MKPDKFLKTIVDPSLIRLDALVGIKVSDQSRVLSMTICGQESNWQHRKQVGGPARGYGQFEKMGGVAEVFQKTPRQLRDVCDDQDIPFEINTVYEAMAWHDLLGMTMVRLLLWQDPHPLPAVGQKEAAWQYYLRNWRPGAPHPESWITRYDQSLAAMSAP